MAIMASATLVMPFSSILAKLAFEHLPPAEVTWGRFLVQTLLIAPVLFATEGWAGFVPRPLAGQICRGVMAAIGNLLFYLGLEVMPVADALAIFFVAPLFVVIVSALLGAERAPPGVWVAVSAGFAGALLVIRPSYAEIGPTAILPLGSALLTALYFHLNRQLSAVSSTVTMHFWSSLFGMLSVTIVLAAGASLGITGFTPIAVDANVWATIAAIGAITTTGQLLIIHAFHMAPAARLAPVQYFEIVMTTLLALAFFGEWPDALRWLGIAIIVGSGLYVFRGTAHCADADRVRRAR